MGRWGGGILTIPSMQGQSDLGSFLGASRPRSRHPTRRACRSTSRRASTAPATASRSCASTLGARRAATGTSSVAGESYWLGPFGGWPEVRASATAQAPWTSLDAARRALTSGMGKRRAAGCSPAGTTRITLCWSTDTCRQALRPTSSCWRPTARPWRSIDRAASRFRRSRAAARVGGRWYVATVQPAGELTATVVWLLDGAQAREIARVPRVGIRGATARCALARRLDGRALGLVVDGQADGERGPAMRWVVVRRPGDRGGRRPRAAGARRSVRPNSHAVHRRRRRVAGRPALPGSRDPPHAAPGRETLVQNPFARVRLSSQRVCFERAGGHRAGSPTRRPVATAEVPHRARRRDEVATSAPSTSGSRRRECVTRSGARSSNSPETGDTRARRSRSCKGAPSRLSRLHGGERSLVKDAASFSMRPSWHAHCTRAPCPCGVRLPPRPLCAGTFFWRRR